MVIRFCMTAARYCQLYYLNNATEEDNITGEVGALIKSLHFSLTIYPFLDVFNKFFPRDNLLLSVSEVPNRYFACL